MYGDKPDRWDDALDGAERLRFIVNCFTRLALCGRRPAGWRCAPKVRRKSRKADSLIPWFEAANARWRGPRIVFGHWSTLGFFSNADVIGLDTGCVWGGSLTAVRLDAPDAVPVCINCKATRRPFGDGPARRQGLRALSASRLVRREATSSRPRRGRRTRPSNADPPTGRRSAGRDAANILPHIAGHQLRQHLMRELLHQFAVADPHVAKRIARDGELLEAGIGRRQIARMQRFDRRIRQRRRGEHDLESQAWTGRGAAQCHRNRAARSANPGALRDPTASHALCSRSPSHE